jgi:hypothetical protein
MGVHIPVLDFLLKFRARALGDMLILGRQGWHIPLKHNHPEYIAADALLKRYDPGATLESLHEGGYADPLFRYLGATSVTAMDASPYEGAQIIHDLNEPVPPDMRNRFDCIFDGGTIEHVYDVPATFRNVAAMLKVGGLFLLCDGANNFLGHGLYQFSPELLWRAFSREAGFRIELMQLVDESSAPEPKDCKDMEGRRQEIRHTAGSTLLLMAARKIRDATAKVYQGDYVAAWHPEGRPSGDAKRLRGWMSRVWRLPLRWRATR